MITDPERYKHNKSAYERPTSGYRCGRESFWSKPCHQGPGPDGSCGGTSECAPVKNAKGRYECKRPARAGGSCADGPLPDGSCSLKHPPCVPRPTLRTSRGRLAGFFFAAVIAAIGGFLVLSRTGSDTWSPVNPGPLSAKHANYAGENGCVTCHSVHHQSLAEWIQAFFIPSDLSTQCLKCHQFGGPQDRPHNTVFPERSDLGKTDCVLCHTEHKGFRFDITAMEDQQCNTCHKTQFKSFTDGHPQFGEDFPHTDRTAVQFNHVSHFNRHFKNPSAKNKGPQTCTGCHQVEPMMGRHMVTGGFEQNCASCHTTDVYKNELVLFRTPELLTQRASRKEIYDACGPIMWTFLKEIPESGEKIKKESEEFVSVSLDEPALIAGYLLGTDADDLEGYDAPMQELMMAMATEDVDALAELLNEKAGSDEVSSLLLAGLDPELLKLAACTWLANEEYEPVGSGQFGGWHAEYLELKYKAAGHGDPIIRNWIEFALSAPKKEGDPANRDRALEMRDDLISSRSGVGRCAKCHAVTTVQAEDGTERLAMEWEYHKIQSRPFTFYSHASHLGLLGGGSEACLKCHVMDPESKYGDSFKDFDPSGFASNFKAIRKETCLQCHGAAGKNPALSGTRQDCLLCHTYHREPAVGMQASSAWSPHKNTGSKK